MNQIELIHLPEEAARA